MCKTSLVTTDEWLKTDGNYVVSTDAIPQISTRQPVPVPMLRKYFSTTLLIIPGLNASDIQNKEHLKINRLQSVYHVYGFMGFTCLNSLIISCIDKSTSCTNLSIRQGKLHNK